MTKNHPNLALEVDHLDQHWLKKGTVKQTNWQCLCLLTVEEMNLQK